MLIILGFLLGAVLGPLRARKLGGRKLDMLHYGVAYALIGMLLALMLSIIIERLV